MLMYLYIALCVTIETLQHMLYRMAGRNAKRYSALVSAGVCLHLVEQVFWYLLLRSEPMGVVLPLTGASYATVAMASAWFLGERITPRRGAGIACVILGFMMVARYMEL
jgi:drug/metabolite transporter (DMT)-like permease